MDTLQKYQPKEVRDDDDELVHESLSRTYYNQHYDSEHSGCINLNPERFTMQQDFELSSSSLKMKRRKTENILEAAAAAGRIIHPAGKKDRHSKVSTARGTRDRRLRLAPKTAIQFYDVQDRLGYDRPSKAIDWLMKEAKAAIDALDNHGPPPAAAAVPNGYFLKSENESGVVSNLGFFANDEFNSSVRRTYECPEDFSGNYHDNYRQDGILSAPLTSSWEIFDWNPELCRMQMFSQREPLQSSISRIAANCSPIISAPFPGICYSSEEISSFSAPPMLKVDEMDKIGSGEPFSAASFLCYEK